MQKEREQLREDHQNFPNGFVHWTDGDTPSITFTCNIFMSRVIHVRFYERVRAASLVALTLLDFFCQGRSTHTIPFLNSSPDLQPLLLLPGSLSLQVQ